MSERELLHSIVIAAPIDAVWAELTRLDGRQRAMMDTVLDSTLEPGAPLYYKSDDGTRVFIVGRVIEVDRAAPASHTQRVTTRDDPFTVVTWTLEEVDGGTRVTMRHTGWPEDTKKLNQVDGTWASIMPSSSACWRPAGSAAACGPATGSTRGSCGRCRPRRGPRTSPRRRSWIRRRGRSERNRHAETRYGRQCAGDRP